MIKAAFLDRDGVINKEIDYLYKIDDFEFTEGCIDGLKHLQDAGFSLFVVTNQSGIGRGYYTPADYQRLTDWYTEQLAQQQITIVANRYCPHHPEDAVGAFKTHCQCRKPKPGMLIDLAQCFAIDLDASIIIGDKLSDVQAGIAAGVGSQYLVRTGHPLPEGIEQRYPVFDTVLDVSLSLR